MPPNDSASLGEVSEAQAKGLGSQGRGTVRVKGKFQNREVSDFRHVTLRLDQGLLDGELGGKGELVSKLDGTLLPVIELKPVRGAAQANWALFRTPYGDVPEVQVTLRNRQVAGSSQNILEMEMEITNATIDTPATCEVIRGKRVSSLGTQLTIVNEGETILPVHPQWECRLREDQLVLHDTAVAPTKAECKTVLGFCRTGSP